MGAGKPHLFKVSRFVTSSELLFELLTIYHTLYIHQTVDAEQGKWAWHHPFLNSSVVLFLGWTIPQVRFEPCATFVKGDRMSKVPDMVIRFGEG